MATSRLWEKKSQRSAPGRYFYFSGRAYNGVLAGKNPTNQLSTHWCDREKFFRDKAVKLCDADLVRFDGTEGAPLCFDHNEEQVVGTVLHSWIGDGNQRNLKIIGRVDKEMPLGKMAVEAIKNKTYSALSVSYGTDLDENVSRGITTLADKFFRHVALVPEPFFDNCRLGGICVEASKKETSFPVYYTGTGKRAPVIRVNIEASMEQPASTGEQAVPESELLGEAAKMKESLTESESRIKELEAELAKKDAANVEVQKREQQKDAKYRERQQSKWDAYKAEFFDEKSNPGAMKAVEFAYMNRQAKELAKAFEKTLKDKLDLRKQVTDALEREKAHQTALEEARQKERQQGEIVTRTTQLLAHSRGNFAKAMAPKSEEEGTEEKRKVQTGVNAGRVEGLMDRIPNPIPSEYEKEHLRYFGYATEPGVSAGAEDKMMPDSFAKPPLPSRGALYDHAETGEETDLAMTESYRKNWPGLFSLMCSDNMVRSDLSMYGEVRKDTKLPDTRPKVTGQ
jgi:hypothetical protein